MFVATILSLVLLWLYFWHQLRDPFHPCIFFLPQFVFIYGWLPLTVASQDWELFLYYTGGNFLYFYHAIVLGLIACLVGGVVYATRGASRREAKWRMLRLQNAKTIRTVALGLGLLGLAAFVYGVSYVGGFEAAYGRSYGSGGGGGYVKEMRFIGLVGAVFVYLLRAGKRMRPSDWALVILCLAPTLVHGLLGARRGPTFLALVVLVGGYVYFMRTRVPLLVLVAGGLLFGFTILFLVANRGSIYFGAEVGFVRNPLSFLERWSSNEYIVGSAAIRYANEFGSFYGVREFAHLLGRFLPTSIWPTVYTDLPAMFGFNIDLRVNGGLDPSRMAAVTGWYTPIGSAEGFAGSLWVEFGAFAFPVSFLIGVLYGRVWLSASENVNARVAYLLMIALSIYLVMQALDPWLYRLLLLGGPTYLLAGFIKVRKTEHFVGSGRLSIATTRLRRGGYGR